MNTIAPTRTTTRLSQVGQRVRERSAVLDRFVLEGVPLEIALALLGTARQVVGRSRARYHRQRLRTAPLPEPAPLAVVEEEALIDEELGI